MMGLAAQEFAGTLQKIDHINVAPEMLSTAIVDLIRAGTSKIAAEAAGGE